MEKEYTLKLNEEENNSALNDIATDILEVEMFTTTACLKAYNTQQGG